jgi:hypothetical protein
MSQGKKFKDACLELGVKWQSFSVRSGKYRGKPRQKQPQAEKQEACVGSVESVMGYLGTKSRALMAVALTDRGGILSYHFGFSGSQKELRDLHTQLTIKMMADGMCSEQHKGGPDRHLNRLEGRIEGLEEVVENK